MPNWVSNTMTVTGDEADVKAFADKAGQPALMTVDGESISRLSFANFVRPDASIMDEYWGEEPRKASLEEALKHESNHWYDWNVRNWGCKWDASVQDVDDTSLDTGYVAYYFETPWGQPQEFFEAVVKQFPDLDFNLRFVEEQGWGGECGGSGGEFFEIEEWDIPETHEKTMEHIGYCKCEEMRPDEMEWAYDDCPKKKEKVSNG